MTKVWADAIVGTRIRYSINEKWRVGLTADIGAGNANLDWQIFGFVGYRFKRPARSAAWTNPTLPTSTRRTVTDVGLTEILRNGGGRGLLRTALTGC